MYICLGYILIYNLARSAKRAHFQRISRDITYTLYIYMNVQISSWNTHRCILHASPLEIRMSLILKITYIWDLYMFQPCWITVTEVPSKWCRSGDMHGRKVQGIPVVSHSMIKSVECSFGRSEWIQSNKGMWESKWAIINIYMVRWGIYSPPYLYTGYVKSYHGHVSLYERGNQGWHVWWLCVEQLL